MTVDGQILDLIILGQSLNPSQHNLPILYPARKKIVGANGILTRGERRAGLVFANRLMTGSKKANWRSAGPLPESLMIALLFQGQMAQPNTI